MKVFSILRTLVFFSASFSCLANASISLDGSFGNGGRVLIQDAPGSRDDTLAGIHLTSDQKIVLVDGNNGHGAVVFRFLPSGAPDLSFGNQGRVLLPYEDAYQANKSVQLSDGKILIQMSHRGPSTRDHFGMRFVRLLPNGQLDAAFGNNGTAYILETLYPNLPSYVDIAPETFEVASDGSIWAIAGDAFKLTPEGRLEKKVDINCGDPHAMAPQANGRMLIAGTVHREVGPDTVVCSLNPDGSRDTAFGKHGEVIVDLAPWYKGEPSGDCAHAITVGADGQILLGTRFGTSGTSSEWYCGHGSAVVKLRPTGDIDTAFADRGAFVSDVPFSNLESVRSFLIDGKGRVTIALSESRSNEGNILLRRLLKDGSLDQDFGDHGEARLSMDLPPHKKGAMSKVTSILQQADGRLLLGASFSPTYDFAYGPRLIPGLIRFE